MEARKRSRALTFVAIVFFFLSIANPRLRGMYLFLGIACVVVSLRQRKPDPPPPEA